jgi:hypothetical protein
MTIGGASDQAALLARVEEMRGEILQGSSRKMTDTHERLRAALAVRYVIERELQSAPRLGAHDSAQTTWTP